MTTPHTQLPKASRSTPYPDNVRTPEGGNALLDRALRYLRRFWKNNRGNYAVVFALSLAPLTTAVGAAVDLSRAVLVHNRLTHALDAAGLAVGGAVGQSEERLRALAQDFFNANYPATELGTPGQITVQSTERIVTISASAEVSTLIMGLVGIDAITVAATTEVTRETKGLEVVMVLDNTGSMNSSNKIGALRDAAEELVHILFGDAAYPEKLRASLVPFVTAVNIKNDEFSMDWIDTDARSTWQGTNFFEEDGERISHLELFDRMDVEWKGCVESRAAPYDVLDTPPDPGNPDTLFTPYLWPDEPDNGDNEYHNKYLPDERKNKECKKKDLDCIQRSLRKYGRNSPSIDDSPSSTRGPNMSCANPLVPLTNNRDYLLDRIRGMKAWNNSGTNAAAGLSWGWRVLSPTPPFTTGKAYDDPDYKKALILLTDGENTIFGGWNSHNRSNYSSYGYLAQERLGTSNRGTAANRINDKVAELCTNIKAQGIRIYTITFRLNSNSVREVFRNCASEPKLYFDSPSNEELRTVFQKIAQDLSNLRISK